MEIALAIRWYLVLQLFGLAALPLTLRLFRHLPGRGYAFARPLGLLVGGWLFWLLLILGWLPNSAGAVLAALVLLAVLGAVLWISPPLRAADGESGSKQFAIPWRHILAVEILLAVAFAAWCGVRAHMPRIETAGGEKWMEIAFLNAILRAPRFPPHDPWLSGFAISYYYFGYLMTAMLAKLSAVPATVGFNLGIASLFALTCSGAYGLVYALLAAKDRHKALWGGLLGPLTIALTGNLEGLLEVLHARGLFSAAFWQWLDIRSINGPPPSLAQGSWMPSRFIWWWQASRVLHDYWPWHTAASPAEIEIIDEFPAFSFLLGDMHPHLLSLPFVLLALALALALLKKPEAWRPERWNFSLPLSPWELFFYALCLGGLAFLDVSSDLVVYLFVVMGAAFIATRSVQPQLTWRTLVPLLVTALVLAVGGVLLYLPFWLGYQSQVSGLAANLFNGTRLPQFLVMFAPILFPAVVIAVREACQRRVNWFDIATWALGLLLALLIFLIIAGFASPQGRQYIDAWRNGEPIPGLAHVPNAAEMIVARLRQRLLAPWTPLALAALLATSILSILKPWPTAAQSKTRRPEADFVLLLIVTGALLTLTVEFVYVRDNFGTRMNTVFKFYFQAWVLWGIAAAYGLNRMLAIRRPWAVAASGIALLLVIAGLVYPALAIPTRAREYGASPTLDGAAYLYQHHADDMAAIEWLNENVAGIPVILEAPADHGGAYRYEGRVSAFTGLPTVLGWAGHQHQWRGDYAEPARREPHIEAIYASSDIPTTLALLEQYDIRYVYVGPVERARYPISGIENFAAFLTPVYSAGDVVIYQYLPDPEAR
ncbi:MAG: hypothetical protein JW900_03790 [Anaerolineae bacterium]|nr:hypothetical protein [Anaerolineae bacterium]